MWTGLKGNAEDDPYLWDLDKFMESPDCREFYNMREIEDDPFQFNFNLRDQVEPSFLIVVRLRHPISMAFSGIKFPARPIVNF